MLLDFDRWGATKINHSLAKYLNQNASDLALTQALLPRHQRDGFLAAAWPRYTPPGKPSCWKPRWQRHRAAGPPNFLNISKHFFNPPFATKCSVAWPALGRCAEHARPPAPARFVARRSQDTFLFSSLPIFFTSD